ncbi:chloride channel protein [Legionella donaldsonii]|uniref:Chloride channel protein n=1 Tax=Legionella donaldsonii TaxID=45060 RepID=A0A378J0C4_9GAMM|nr:chloride channel protein [Legionella donaldsonii]STX41173.1 chloride channel protein [Legionella donaldsonii]
MTSFSTPTLTTTDKVALGREVPNVKIILLATLGGAAIGTTVAGIRFCVGFIQTILFGTDVNLNAVSIAPWRLMAIILPGSLLLGLLLVLAGRFNRLSIVDPVEANALEGGKMSFMDSLTLVGLSAVSITIGGSVGFEAAMTQLGAGTLSAIGQRLKLPRSDLRILVSCGTGAGIAAIFGAPLAGAFYALELVIGGYGMRALLPTLLASAMSSHAIYTLIGYRPIFLASHLGIPALWHFPLALVVGVSAAIVGIAVMRGTTAFENLLQLVGIPAALKPVIGGLILASISLLIPQVMGPGHHSIGQILDGYDLIGPTLALLLAKIAASVACVGSGFRGGLFSTSLFMGAALGCLIHGLLIVPFLGSQAPLDLTVIAGMAGVATSIIGTPIAIVLLTLETAGLQVGVVTTAITVVIANYLTRYWFGYSFSTWRFHVRGNDLSSPRDIGRLRSLKFADLALINPLRVTPNHSMSELLPLLETNNQILAVVEHNRFIGFIRAQHLLASAATNPQLPLDKLIEKPSCVHATDSLAQHIESNKENFTNELVVLDNKEQLLGYTTEAIVLRRYLEEILTLDREDANAPLVNLPNKAS